MEIFSRLRDYFYSGLEEAFNSCFIEEKDSSRFVGKQFKGEERSTFDVNFDGETPGDILGVNIYDPELTRECLKRAANKIFKLAHPDKFSCRSFFARTYHIETVERAKDVFAIYRRAYEEFCDEKEWNY